MSFAEWVNCRTLEELYNFNTIMENGRGKTAGEIDEMLPTDVYRSAFLDNTSKDKSKLSKFFEACLTGTTHDTCAEADWYGLEIKAVLMKDAGARVSKYQCQNFPQHNVKEVLRATKLNYATLADIPYDQSPLYKKGLAVVGIFRFVPGWINQTENVVLSDIALCDYRAEAEADYNVLSSLIKNNQQCTIHSRNDDRFSVIQPYSNAQKGGTGEKSIYLKKQFVASHLQPLDLYW